jgi:hypothetical protein
MTLERNCDDLRRHAADFAARIGFTYTVIDARTHDVVGCVYIYPAKTGAFDAEVRSWVRASHSSLDRELFALVSDWLATTWPFSSDAGWHDDPSGTGDAFAAATASTPRTLTTRYLYFRIHPRRMQAWCEADELEGPELMRYGRWLQA